MNKVARSVARKSFEPNRETAILVLGAARGGVPAAFTSLYGKEMTCEKR
jgi:hypothetical protein